MGLALIKGMGLGAGLMYFFDPQLGRRRRALVTDQFTHACCSLEGTLGKATRDLGNRTRGVVAGVGHRLHPEPAPTDEVLVERVRATLGHHTSHPRSIEVAAMNGHVVLRGPIPASELEGLLQAVSSVRGVVDVADELQIRHDGDPAAQGARPRVGAISGLWQEEWTPATKLLIGAAGVAVALPLIRRSPLTGLALGAVGLVLATRSLEGGRPGGGRGRIDVTGRSERASADGTAPGGAAPAPSRPAAEQGAPGNA